VSAARFLDHLATDIEHLERLNQLLGSGRISQLEIEGCERTEPLASFVITPSVDLSEPAEQHRKDMPYLIQYFMNKSGARCGFVRGSDELPAVHIQVHECSRRYRL
jgi:hypothetical protein